ncbi:MAG: LysR family transcriptional regulator [Planctomycetota bacterium]|nr:LysR family transcriptional regulator [Planctomycetota bacterium]
MEFDQLRYFVQVAEHQNFTRAAEELGVSQSSLSRSIQRLEDELGMPVFVRRTKALELTDAGLLLLSRAKNVLSIVEDTKAEICDDGVSGRIRVGAIPTIAPYFLPEFLRDFSSEFPQASVVIHEETTARLLKACSQGEVDVAIMAAPIDVKYLQVEELFEEELFLVLPPNHNLVEQKDITLEDVGSYSFVMLDEAHCLSGNILTFCRRNKFQPSVIGKTNQISMVQELVSLDHGISILPKMAHDLDISERRVYRSFHGEKPMRQLVMVWDPYRFQPKMLETFRNRLKDFVAKM